MQYKVQCPDTQQASLPPSLCPPTPAGFLVHYWRSIQSLLQHDAILRQLPAFLIGNNYMTATLITRFSVVFIFSDRIEIIVSPGPLKYP